MQCGAKRSVLTQLEGRSGSARKHAQAQWKGVFGPVTDTQTYEIV